MGSVLQVISKAHLKLLWKLLTTHVNKECFVKDIYLTYNIGYNYQDFFRLLGLLGIMLGNTAIIIPLILSIKLENLK